GPIAASTRRPSATGIACMQVRQAGSNRVIRSSTSIETCGAALAPCRRRTRSSCSRRCGSICRSEQHAMEETMKRVLITGAGTGFGHEAAMRLAEKGFDVIATVEIWAQIQTLKRQAKTRGVTLTVEKLDVTSDGDRRKALAWDVEILVNN